MRFCENELLRKKLPEIWPDKTVDWETRRLEIADILQSELFGYRPADPEEISFTVLPPESYYHSFCAGKATLQKINVTSKLCGKTFTFPFYAVIPKQKKNLPFFIHINFRSDVPDRYMPTEEIIDNGFAVFSFGYQDVTSDDMDFTNGLAGILYDGREKPAATAEKSRCGPGRLPELWTTVRRWTVWISQNPRLSVIHGSAKRLCIPA